MINISMYYTPPQIQFLQHCSCKHVFSIRGGNSVDPDQIPRWETLILLHANKLTDQCVWSATSLTCYNQTFNILSSLCSLADWNKPYLIQIYTLFYNRPWGYKTFFMLNSAEHEIYREGSGSVVECLTWDRGAAGSSLTGITVLWSLSKTHLS